MLPLIFGARDGKKGIFMPFHLGKGIKCLYHFKYFGEVGVARKVGYCIECESENHVKSMEKVDRSGGRDRHR